MSTSAEELADFLAASAAADDLAAFRFSEATARRVEDLIRREKNDEATAEEREEIDAALALGHLLTLTRLRIAERDDVQVAAAGAAPPAAAPLEPSVA